MRILFLADVQNLFYSARDLYGQDARIDFKHLKEEAVCNRPYSSLRCIAYLTHFSSRDDIEGLKKALAVLAYDVRVSLIRRTDEGLIGTDIDIDMANDAIAKADEYDVIVVASGDADLIPAYKIVRDKGKRVEVLAFENSASKILHGVVDEVRFLGKGVLYDPVNTKKPKKEQKVSD